MQVLMKMMTQQIFHQENMGKDAESNNIDEKINELTHSVKQVYKYELLTTNQYLQQMELVLEIFNELSTRVAEQNQ
jgi:hypothetical protein